MKRVCVTGAGGFIGHHLVTFLKQEGYWVRGVDLKYPEYTEVDADEFELLDLRRWDAALQATRGVDQVYALAADMGGIGYISTHHAEILQQQRAHQPAHARGRTDQRRAAIPVQLLGLHLSGVPADRARRGAAEGERRLPGRAAGRLRVGEAVHRAAVLVLRRASTRCRHASSGSTTSTGRSARTTAAGRRLRRRSAGRSRSPRTAAASRSGATGSRRGRSATSTTASRASTASCSPTTPSRSTSAPTKWCPSNELAHLVAEVAGKRDIGLKHDSGSAGGARTQLRQLAAAQGPRVGADDVPARRARPHLPVDREEADQP